MKIGFTISMTSGGRKSLCSGGGREHGREFSLLEETHNSHKVRVDYLQIIKARTDRRGGNSLAGVADEGLTKPFSGISPGSATSSSEDTGKAL